MKIKYLILLFTVGILISNCTKSSNHHNIDITDDMVWIEDEQDRNLPAYTESGYNTFGVKYEKDYFTSVNNVVPAKMKYEGDKMLFMLDGTLEVDNKYRKRMSMYFLFPFEKCVSYEDLLKLHNVPINLAASDCEVKLMLDSSANNTTAIKLDVIEGELHFKRAQKLNINDRQMAVILSGIFSLKIKDAKGGEFPLLMKNGRFDLVINNNYFTFLP